MGTIAVIPVKQLKEMRFYLEQQIGLIDKMLQEATGGDATPARPKGEKDPVPIDKIIELQNRLKKRHRKLN